MHDRRTVVIGGVAGLATLALPVAAAAPAMPALGPQTQLGWSALDLGSGQRAGLNEHLRLPMCSSFKWLLAACLLARVDHGTDRLDAPVTFGPADLLATSPVTSAAVKAAGGGRATMSVGALAAAITSVSDNAAANLLLARVGGPLALTGWLRAQGDRVTRLDRTEPELNRVGRGDPRDTTTPAQAIADLHRFLYGDLLTPAARARLMGWMLDCHTGEGRFRAGLPAGWRLAHRTGTRDHDPGDGPGERGAAVDLGVLLPPVGAPILLAAFAAGWTRPLTEVEAWMAGLTRRIAQEWRA